MHRIAIALYVLSSLAVGAGDPPGFALFTASELKGVEQQLLQNLSPQKTASRQFNDSGTHLMLLAHVEADGAAEIHQTLNDIFIIRAGEATLTVGGKVIGAKTTAPGEIRGTSIQGGVTKKLAAGDVVNIPPNTPHQTRVSPGRQVTYLVIKIKAK